MVCLSLGHGPLVVIDGVTRHIGALSGEHAASPDTLWGHKDLVRLMVVPRVTLSLGHCLHITGHSAGDPSEVTTAGDLDPPVLVFFSQRTQPEVVST